MIRSFSNALCASINVITSQMHLKVDWPSALILLKDEGGLAEQLAFLSDLLVTDLQLQRNLRRVLWYD